MHFFSGADVDFRGGGSTSLCLAAATRWPQEDVMKYLCLIYDEETKRRAMPKAETDAYIRGDWLLLVGAVGLRHGLLVSCG